MRLILVTIACTFLASALAYYVTKIKWLALVLLVCGVAGAGYAAWNEATDSGDKAKPVATFAVGRSGRVWLKLAASPKEELPERWGCRVSSFSGEWQGQCNKTLMRKRGRTWSPKEVVAKFPPDVVGSTDAPAPGTYEVEWTTPVAGEDGAIVDEVIARTEFRYE